MPKRSMRDTIDRPTDVAVRAVPFIHTDRLVVTFGSESRKEVLDSLSALTSHGRSWLACLCVLLNKPESVEVVDGNVCARWSDVRGRQYWSDAVNASISRGFTAFTDYSFFLNKHTFTTVLPCL